MNRTEKLGAGLMVLVLIGSVFVVPGVFAQETGSVSVSQSAQGSTTVAPGDTLAVDVTVETTAAGAPAISLENVPSGWSVDIVDLGGGTSGAPANPNQVVWLDSIGDNSHTITYEVTVPSGASEGTSSIDAVGSAVDAGDNNVQDTDALSVTVEEETTEPPAEDDEEVTIEVRPTSGQTATIGDDVTYDVYVSGAGDGVGSLDVGVEIADTNVGSVSGASASVSGSGPGAGVSQDGGSASFQDTGLSEAGPEVLVGSVDVSADAVGTTSIDVTTSQAGDTGADEYDTVNTVGSSLTVEEEDEPPEPFDPPAFVDDNEAQDLDGDGLYEDVDGDGDFDIVDVDALYRVLDGQSDVSNGESLSAPAFDFDGDGDIDGDDDDALLQLLNS